MSTNINALKNKNKADFRTFKLALKEELKIVNIYNFNLKRKGV